MAQESAVRTHALRFEVHHNAEETTVVCTGKIIAETTMLLQSTVQPLIPATKRLVLDLTDVEYMDSSGMGALARLWVSTKRVDCELKVINLNERIKELLRISNLLKVLEGDHEFHKYLS